MRAFWKSKFWLIGGVILSFALAIFAQKPPPPPARHPSTPATAPSTPATAPQPTHHVVVVEPVRVFDPYFDYPYPYAYPPDYMATNFGYVKIKTDRKDASVYVDGGFADKVEKAKKFALRPGTHEIELRDSDGRMLFHQRVAVLVGKTTELHAG